MFPFFKNILFKEFPLNGFDDTIKQTRKMYRKCFIYIIVSCRHLNENKKNIKLNLPCNTIIIAFIRHYTMFYRWYKYNKNLFKYN